MAPEPLCGEKGDILTKFGAYDVEAAYKEEVTGGKLSGEAFLQKRYSRWKPRAMRPFA